MRTSAGPVLRAGQGSSATLRALRPTKARHPLGVHYAGQLSKDRPQLQPATVLASRSTVDATHSIVTSPLVDGFPTTIIPPDSPVLPALDTDSSSSLTSSERGSISLYSSDVNTSSTVTSSYNNILPYSLHQEASSHVYVVPGSISVYNTGKAGSDSRVLELLTPVIPSEVHGAGATALGRRSTNEDHHSLAFIHHKTEQGSGWVYGGVFDGHGGDATAACLADLFHHSLHMQLEQQQKRQSQRQQQGQQQQLQSAVHDAFVSFDSYWSHRCHDNSGSTAVVALINGNNLLVANAGDSVAVIASNGRPRRLSACHKPENPEEAARIRASGGLVERHPRVPGVWRALHNPAKLSPEERRVRTSLGVTRGFGDYKFKRPVGEIVTAEPHIVQLELQPADNLLLLTSDGVTDVLHDNSMVQVALQAVAEAQQETDDGQDLANAAATAVTDAALRMGAVDNVTVVAMLLNWPN